ncbi:Zn-dependent hydrolase, glyoxylase [Mycolicibacterium chubuense NBB4]|uniref:Zn-dependent hydrolase, glyoxylase n=1 Tax=Mycolicibacterium chubuense (strain NBB4) TaxID=710421 RepID=I4BKH3_MYCCN|nr:MBL fold metallo-hydrolase [Mycolicibacterium chubuense]AFM17780.1 Zn-dependent hydrolase, glyoxylase [Mycolicibacterium chubuense NBB4]
MNLRWEALADRVLRCRLTFCDVTVGLVHGSAGVLLVDTGTTLAEAGAVAEDVEALTGGPVTHVVLTHDHFDHIMGYSVFARAQTYCAPEVAVTMATRRAHLRRDAVRHGAAPEAVDRALAVLRAPVRPGFEGTVGLGDRTVTVTHPGSGHTGHDLIAVVTGAERTVAFCGDLIEESADPCVDADSDIGAWPATLEKMIHAGGEDAVYVPGHGAAVDASFVRRQGEWLARLG